MLHLRTLPYLVTGLNMLW